MHSSGLTQAPGLPMLRRRHRRKAAAAQIAE
jgi:hypothetical protein